jgi:hypothetical protein
MRLTTLKVTISLVCAGFAAVHLLAPTINIDAVTLGLLAIGLLPWFQPLVKSLELPGGLKIELQDVKAAMDKISSSLASETRTEAADNLPPETGLLSFISKVAEQDPNLALVGLRIEVEKLLVEIAEATGVATERRGANALLNELSRRAVIPSAVAAGLTEFVSLGNQAAHGATVSKDAAAWALAIAPQFLGALSALRLKSSEPVTLTGEIPKAEVMAAYEKQSPIRIRFPKPFARSPHVSVGFYGLLDDDLASGSLQVQQSDEHGFSLHVASMPNAHSVAIWSVKWKATGQGT